MFNQIDPTLYNHLYRVSLADCAGENQAALQHDLVTLFDGQTGATVCAGCLTHDSDDCQFMVLTGDPIPSKYLGDAANTFSLITHVEERPMSELPKFGEELRQAALRKITKLMDESEDEPTPIMKAIAKMMAETEDQDESGAPFSFSLN